MEATEQLDSRELVKLGAVDPVFYAHHFFPKTVRKSTPQFHRDVWAALRSEHRYLNIQIFRDGAKTTLLRLFTSYIVAYGLARTIVYIGKSEDHALRSVDWIRQAVLKNHHWRSTFGLLPGPEVDRNLHFSESQADIVHTVEDHRVSILGLGITGSVRGINIEDHRPDLIVVDDPLDDENAATPDQRKKINERFFGAIKESLAPATEALHAKLVLLQTPIDSDDLSEVCKKDIQFLSLMFGILDNDNKSVWEDRWPTATVLEDKAAAASRGPGFLNLWLREKMCTIVASESKAFRAENLRFWDIVPEGLDTIIAIDPAPIQSDEAKAREKKTDQQAVAVWSRKGPNYYLREYSIARDQDPDQLAAEYFRLFLKYKPRKTRVEAVAYQRTLKWYLEKKAKELRLYPLFEEVGTKDKRKKTDRITQAFGGASALGCIWVHKTHTDFIEQFSTYSVFGNPRDDLLDASAMAIEGFGPARVSDDEEKDYKARDADVPDLPNFRAAP